MRDETLKPTDPNQITEQASSERRSKLFVVREQLRVNPAVFCAGEIVNHSRTGAWTETVDIIVAPVNPIFDVGELNQFMDSLVTIKTSTRDAAFPQGGGIHLGRLYYDEPIGRRIIETTTVVTPIEVEALQKAGINIGETFITRDEDIMRRTWLRVYPNVSSARAIFEYERGIQNGTVEPNSTFDYLEYEINAEQIRRMKENQEDNPFVKIAGKLRGRT